MFTMVHDIELGGYKVGMLEKVEIHRSVELLADTAVITLPGSQYNYALDVEGKIRRGDKVVIRLGYDETGLVEEFTGWIQRIGTDNGAITLECEDDLFKMRVPLADREVKNTPLSTLLEEMLQETGGGYSLDCSYEWTYEKFVINTATAYDVLKKVQEESGADIYLKGSTLHVHAPGEKTGKDVLYDFAMNVQECDLAYRNADERKVRVVVKALLPDGSVKEREFGSTGGDKVEVKSASPDDESMRLRGESEHKRLSFDGYDGDITAWLVPHVVPGDCVELHDKDYEYKDGRYFVRSVETEFGSGGATRKITLGFRLS